MLKIDNLSVTYNSTEEKVLGRISFEVKKGEIVALLGPSGCGKTTILNVVAGLLDKKEALIEGEISFEKERKNTKVHVVFQEPRLLPWRNVLRNVSYGLEAQKIPSKEWQQRAKEGIKMIGLNGYENHHPHQLSIGMQQRVNFARALVCKPDVLLLDEPFSALDVDTKKDIQKEFLRIIKDNHITSVFVTHNIDEALYLSNRIIALSGKPAKIKQVIEKGNFKSVSKEKFSYR